MKQVININFQGRVVPIEQTAYDSLKQYIESLNRFFADEPGKEEIINDIESRIGELFQEKLKDGLACITDADVEAVIKSMGTPEDFESEENATGASTSSATGSKKQSHSFMGPKRLFRDESDKVLGGVCSGLGQYFNIDVVIVRIIFVILFFSFGVGLIPYLILWVVVPSTASTEIGTVRKRLFRDVDHKLIAGVCSGIANYFNINVWIPRVLFLIPFLSFVGNWDHFELFRFGFSPSALLIYIILWLVIPEATTTSEKLEMKGEKVDMNSIKNSVMEEMKGVQERARKMGQEAKEFAEKGSLELGKVGKKSGNTLGNIIGLFIKILVYLIVGVICITAIGALFALAVFAIGIFPLKDFILNDGWQNAYAWGTLLFFIAVPIIGIITWIIRKITKVKTGSKVVTAVFSLLWIVGWVSFMMLLVSVGRDFKRENHLQPQEIVLNNPAIDKLELTTYDPTVQYNSRKSIFYMRPFYSIDDDTAIVRNVVVNIFKSQTDSFSVNLIRIANGRTKAYADTSASMIKYNIVQKDSLLLMDRGVQINTHDKFRNQQVIINVYVPVGKKILINNSVPRWDGVHFDGWADIDDQSWSYENEYAMKGWNTGVEYIMRADGLYDMDEKPASKKSRSRSWDQEDRPDNNDYRYDDNGSGTGIGLPPDSSINRTLKAIDSLKESLRLREKKIKDSLLEHKNKIEKELEKIESRTTQPVAMIPFRFSTYNPLL